MVGSVKTVAVAFVDPENAPIFIKRFDGDEHGTDLLFVLNGALDAFDEALASGSGRRASRKSYLGLLNLIDGFAVYGFLSNSLVKTIVVLDAAPNAYAVPSDTVAEAYMLRLYNCYVETVSNPFFDGFDFDLQDQAPGAAGAAAASAAGQHGKPAHPELQQTFHDCIVQLVEQANLA